MGKRFPRLQRPKTVAACLCLPVLLSGFTPSPPPRTKPPVVVATVRPIAALVEAVMTVRSVPLPRHM